ncbi:MAG: N-acetylglucosamine-6-phosphate deacetylase [Acidobacteriaceae bacterium]
MIAVTADIAITPTGLLQNPILVVEDGKIIELTSRSERELPSRHLEYPGCILAPGLIDIHIHGGAGFDVMHASATELAHFERFIAQHGVTSYLPTTVTAASDVILDSVERLGKEVRRREAEAGRARPLGIHLEGPFISHAKRGVHPPDFLQAADVQLFDRFFNAANGTMRMMTFAPELPDAQKFIAHAVGRGVIVSLGHSDANYEQAWAGIKAGAKTATHTFNAMRPLDHRDPGVLGAALTCDTLFADIIADGVHVHPDIVRLFLKMKGDKRAILISDAISATGMPDGRYRLGSFEVDVNGDRCEYEGKLAGSVLTLDRAVRNVVEFGGAAWPLARAVELATRNPAELLRLPNKGRFESGADADIAVFTASGDVRATIIAGQA